MISFAVILQERLILRVIFSRSQCETKWGSSGDSMCGGIVTNYVSGAKKVSQFWDRRWAFAGEDCFAKIGQAGEYLAHPTAGDPGTLVSGDFSYLLADAFSSASSRAASAV